MKIRSALGNCQCATAMASVDFVRQVPLISKPKKSELPRGILQEIAEKAALLSVETLFISIRISSYEPATPGSARIHSSTQ